MQWLAVWIEVYLQGIIPDADPDLLAGGKLVGILDVYLRASSQARKHALQEFPQ
jgi:hypothetical protein